MSTAEKPPRDRRRHDRRAGWIRLADYTIPELRKSASTFALLLVILALFLYMVHEVLVAVIAGLVVGVYLIPFQSWLQRRLKNSRLTAIVTITLVTVPLIALLVYSWTEISDAAEYLQTHQAEVVSQLATAFQELPFTEGAAVREWLTRAVDATADQIARIAAGIQSALGIIAISVGVFLFTVFYILTEHRRLVRYVRGKISGRYRDLAGDVSGSIQAVVYGALYATFLTQLLKSAVILGMNLAFDVPLAFVLAIVSFFIGFFPVVGSWTVYAPTAVYLIVFRDDLIAGLAMLAIGFLGITTFVSMYLRPKIAAEKSRVLNFYWMFIALVTGVYTFGLVGIIIGPVLIAVLKAMFEAVTGGAPVTEPADRPHAATPGDASDRRVAERR